MKKHELTMNTAYYFIIIIFTGWFGPNLVLENEYKQNSFEGSVTYKISSVKPEMVSEEDWKKKLKEITGEQGYFVSKNYYRPNQFAAEINTGLSIGKQVYNPIDSLHYSWELESETAITEDKFAESFIKIKNIVDLDTTATINDITCKAVKVNMTIGHTIIWYNSELLSFNADEYKGALFSKEIIAKINTLPVKAEIPGMMIIEMMEHKKEVINGDLFIIPKFKKIQKKPSF